MEINIIPIHSHHQQISNQIPKQYKIVQSMQPMQSVQPMQSMQSIQPVQPVQMIPSQQYQQYQKPIIQKMSLADRDNYLVQIEQQIQSKRNLLLSKRKFLDNTIKQNQFLSGIKNDYTKYYDYISKKRQEELAAMNILKQYTDDLIASNKMTESGINQSKHDQLSILDEMKKIQSALDEIIGSQQQQQHLK
jgi:hypothetical protein